MPWEYPLRLVYRSKLSSFDREKLSSETKYPIPSLNIANVYLHSVKIINVTIMKPRNDHVKWIWKASRSNGFHFLYVVKIIAHQPMVHLWQLTAK